MNSLGAIQIHEFDSWHTPSLTFNKHFNLTFQLKYLKILKNVIALHNIKTSESVFYLTALGRSFHLFNV